MNKLTLLTDGEGRVRGVRINGHDISTSAVAFEADANAQDVYTVRLSLYADAIFAAPWEPEQSPNSEPPAPAERPRPRYMGDSDPPAPGAGT
jgi:hypothetical protein